MLQNGDIIEQGLWSEPRGGTITVWFDNWTNLGRLFKYPSEMPTCHDFNET